MQHDEIVTISPTLERFFRCTGQMLKPSRNSIEAVLARIPKGQVVTTTTLREHLAQLHGVAVTCPSDTKRVLHTIANDPDSTLPHWRVVKSNGELNAATARGLQHQTAQLEGEGLCLDTSRKKPRVKPLKPWRIT